MARNVHCSLVLLIAPCGIMLLAAGCGDNKFPVRPAQGKVVCNGQPVTIGSVSFVPIGEPGTLETGKSASATIGQDGKFVLTTFNRFDGAIVGKHRVLYNAPEEDGSDEEGGDEANSDVANSDAAGADGAARSAVKSRKPKQKMKYVQKGELILEVKSSGQNDFAIELFPAGK